MNWYLQSTSDRDTHWGELQAGLVRIKREVVIEAVLRYLAR